MPSLASRSCGRFAAVNPLYAAVQVEKTIDDAKNSVAGYVEAQENGQVHPAVKAAMGARAAKTVGDADLNHAVDHRSLAYAGGVAVVFLLALVVLFFVFRPAQFKFAGRPHLRAVLLRCRSRHARNSRSSNPPMATPRSPRASPSP